MAPRPKVVMQPTTPRGAFGAGLTSPKASVAGKSSGKGNGKKVNFPVNLTQREADEPSGFPAWSAEGINGPLPEPVGLSFVNAQRLIQRRQNPQVLLVMPNVVELVAISQRLRRLGCGTHTSRDGREAFLVWHERSQRVEERFDVVIIEREMDWIGGSEFLSMMRQAEVDKDMDMTCVIALCKGSEDHKAVLQEGFTHFLKRPFALHAATLGKLLLPRFMRRKSRAGLMTKTPGWRTVANLFDEADNMKETMRGRMMSVMGISTDEDGEVIGDGAAILEEIDDAFRTFERTMGDLREKVKNLEGELEQYEKLSVKDIMSENRKLRKEVLLVKGHYERRREDIVRMKKVELAKKNASEVSKTELLEVIDDMQKNIDGLRIENELLEENIKHLFNRLEQDKGVLRKAAARFTAIAREKQNLQGKPKVKLVANTKAQRRVLERYEKQLMLANEASTMDFFAGTLGKVQKYGEHTNLELDAENDRPRAEAKCSKIAEEMLEYCASLGKTVEGKLLSSLLTPFKDMFAKQDALHTEFLKQQYNSIIQPKSWNTFAREYTAVTRRYIQKAEDIEVRSFSVMREAFVNFVVDVASVTALQARSSSAHLKTDEAEVEQKKPTPKRELQKPQPQGGPRRQSKKPPGPEKPQVDKEELDRVKEYIKQRDEMLEKLKSEKRAVEMDLDSAATELHKKERDIQMLFVGYNRSQMRLQRIVEDRAGWTQEGMEQQMEALRRELVQSRLELVQTLPDYTPQIEEPEPIYPTNPMDDNASDDGEEAQQELEDAIEAAYEDVDPDAPEEEQLVHNVAASLAEAVARAPNERARRSIMHMAGMEVSSSRRTTTRAVAELIPEVKERYVELCRASFVTGDSGLGGGVSPGSAGTGGPATERLSSNRRSTVALGSPAREEAAADFAFGHRSSRAPTRTGSGSGGTMGRVSVAASGAVHAAEARASSGLVQGLPESPRKSVPEPPTLAAVAEADDEAEREAAVEPRSAMLTAVLSNVGSAGAAFSALASIAEQLYSDLYQIRDIALLGRKGFQPGARMQMDKPPDGAAGWIRRCHRIVDQIRARMQAPEALLARGELARQSPLVEGAPTPGGKIPWQMWGKLTAAVEHTLGITPDAIAAKMLEEQKLWRERRKIVDDFLNGRERIQRAQLLLRHRRKDVHQRWRQAQQYKGSPSVDPTGMVGGRSGGPDPPSPIHRGAGNGYSNHVELGSEAFDELGIMRVQQRAAFSFNDAISRLREQHAARAAASAMDSMDQQISPRGDPRGLFGAVMRAFGRAPRDDPSQGLTLRGTSPRNRDGGMPLPPVGSQAVPGVGIVRFGNAAPEGTMDYMLRGEDTTQDRVLRALRQGEGPKVRYPEWFKGPENYSQSSAVKRGQVFASVMVMKSLHSHAGRRARQSSEKEIGAGVVPQLRVHETEEPPGEQAQLAINLRSNNDPTPNLAPQPPPRERQQIALVDGKPVTRQLSAVPDMHVMNGSFRSRRGTRSSGDETETPPDETLPGPRPASPPLVQGPRVVGPGIVGAVGVAVVAVSMVRWTKVSAAAIQQMAAAALLGNMGDSPVLQRRGSRRRSVSAATAGRAVVFTMGLSRNETLPQGLPTPDPDTKSSAPPAPVVPEETPDPKEVVPAAVIAAIAITWCAGRAALLPTGPLPSTNRPPRYTEIEPPAPAPPRRKYYTSDIHSDPTPKAPPGKPGSFTRPAAQDSRAAKPARGAGGWGSARKPITKQAQERQAATFEPKAPPRLNAVSQPMGGGQVEDGFLPPITSLRV
eukprot:Hpha_TRINITY_DN22517_c0_g1::TRINITY_DN22517_c0_g1_i1::g.185185::m.185185